jgi:CRP/FNR family transcriptional regulator, cyclic AMP receptor protein
MRLRSDAKMSLLATVPLFAGCSKRELAKIAALTDEIDLPAGKTLTDEGRSGREFCVIVTGSVDVKKGTKKLATLKDGDFFGEISLILDAPRSATVTSTSSVRLLVVERQAFQHLMREFPSIQAKVLEALAARLAPESI